MFCKSCGNELKEGAKVCDKCGARLTPSAGNISGAAAGNSNAAKTFSFKIHAKGRSSIFNTIKQFRGAYKADFTVEDNRLLIDETDNYGETVSSVPYYLIKEFSLKESISPMLIFTYLICALVAIALLATGTEILTGILVLIVLVLFMIFLGFKNARFLLTLNDNQKIKIKMSKISKKKKQEKQDFVESMNFKISNAVNTGAVFERAGTALTVGDLRNHVSAEERQSEVEAIKNNHN